MRAPASAGLALGGDGLRGGGLLGRALLRRGLLGSSFLRRALLGAALARGSLEAALLARGAARAPRRDERQRLIERHRFLRDRLRQGGVDLAVGDVGAEAAALDHHALAAR